MTVSDPLDHEDIDLVFAVSASSTDAEVTLQLMKDTLQSIMSTHGTGNIHYTVISYGAQTRRIVDFQDRFPDEEALIKQLQSLIAVGGTPDLDQALDEAKKVFEGPGARPNARKILIFLVDNKSGSTEEDVLKSAMSLEGEGVKVISVGIGSQVKREELQKTTPYKKNVLEVPAKENLETLGKKITNKIRESKLSILFYLTATYTSSIIHSGLPLITQR